MTKPGQVEIIINELHRRANMPMRGDLLYVYESLRSLRDIDVIVTEVLAIADALKAELAEVERGGSFPVGQPRYAHQIIAGGAPCPTCGFKITKRERAPINFDPEVGFYTVPGEGLETMAPPVVAPEHPDIVCLACGSDASWRDGQYVCGGCGAAADPMPPTSITVDLPVFLPLRKGFGGE